MQQKQKASFFLGLHRDKRILVLPNAWDPGGARIFEACGFPAVGTTSMGIAASLGCPDVQVIEFDEMLNAIARIVKSVEIPVNADVEAGYGSTSLEIVTNVERVLHAGAVGINIEDGTRDSNSPLVPPSVQCERIQAIREMAAGHGIPLVVNARTDVFLAGVGAPESRLGHAIERGLAYRAAGADCVFVPGGLDRETIATLVKEIPSPINILANPTTAPPLPPSTPELEELGVARLSVGSAIMKATLALTRRIADELIERGTYDSLMTELESPRAAEAYRFAIGEKLED